VKPLPEYSVWADAEVDALILTDPDRYNYKQGGLDATKKHQAVISALALKYRDLIILQKAEKLVKQKFSKIIKEHPTESVAQLMEKKVIDVENIGQIFKKPRILPPVRLII